MWAWGNGDAKTFLACLSPEAQQREQKHLEAMRPVDLVREFRDVNGFHIVDQQIVADDQVVLHIYVDGVRAEAAKKDARLKKIGADWKLDTIP